MKEKIHYLIEAALAIAVIVLFILQFSGNSKQVGYSATVAGEEDTTQSASMPVAYIDVDSLMMNYTFSLDLNEQIAKKYENSRADMTERLRKFEVEAADFRRKVETGSFLSQERAENEQQRLLKKQEDLQRLEAQYAQELNDERSRINEELRKTIVEQLADYNKDKGYHIIYGNNNILFANDGYNITAEVIEYLNKRHANSPIAKPAE